MIPRWVAKIMVETGMNNSVHEKDGRILEDRLPQSSGTPPVTGMVSPGYNERPLPPRDYQLPK